jgi:2-methylcitrate dehydratase PrpD
MGFTNRLARFILEQVSFNSLPPEVVERSKEMIINAAGVGLAGAAQPEGQAIAQFSQEMGGNGTCTIIGMGLRTSPLYAALANGVMIRALDFDDEIPRRGVHPSSVILPAVLALAEPGAATGPDLLTAYVLGCELVAKLSALDRLDSGLITPVPRSWDVDGVAGTVGATAAAGRLLGLNLAQLEHALGLAAGGAAGIRANFASAGAAYQCGRAAMNGVMAALLAQRGIGSVRGSLEAPGGLLAVCFGGVAPEFQAEVQQGVQDDFFQRLGNPYDVMDPGVALKLYPCGSASHTAIDAVTQLVQQHRLPVDQVASVRVTVAPETLAALPFATPEDGWQARYCLSYLVAAALRTGHPLIDCFTPEAVRDRRVRQLMDRITIEATETATPFIPHPTEVTVTLADGRRLTHRVEFARGQPELPLDPQELDAKFLYCSRYIMPPDHIEESITRFRDLENIDNVSGLISVLGA